MGSSRRPSSANASARKQAEETLEESRATASALEAQHHLLRAQLKALEHKGRGRLFRRNH